MTIAALMLVQRGRLLPVLAQTTRTMPAVTTTAAIFVFFHGPTGLVYWVTLTGIGIAYGWMRGASASTTAPAVHHAAYNFTLCLLAGA